MTVDAADGRQGGRCRYPGSVHGGALAVLVVVLAVYFPAVRNGFVNWDDGQYVVYNPFIRSLDGALIRKSFAGFHAANRHPLTWLSHALDYAIWGPDPFGHHLTNIILHAVNSYCVVLLVVLLLSAGRISAPTAAGRSGGLSGRWVLPASVIAGLLFGVHPVHVESVAWISERKDVLSAFFYIVCLLA